jgi:serine/threonine protein kinase
VGNPLSFSAPAREVLAIVVLGGTSVGASSFKKVSEGNIRGVVREDLLDVLPPGFLKDPVSSVQAMGGKVLKESRWRWASTVVLPDGQRIFLKRDRSKGWFDYLRYVVIPSKAHKEWLIAVQLQRKYLAVPQPMGWMEKVSAGRVEESYYISEFIGSGRSAIEELNRLEDETGVIGLANTVKAIHGSGLCHRDFHAGNFLWHQGSLFLTDLHDASLLRRLSLMKRLRSLAHLLLSLKSIWGEREEIRFLETYFAGEPSLLQKKKEYLEQIHHDMDRLQKRHWRSRTKRCLKESTEFTVEKEGKTFYYRRRDFPLGRIQAALKEHQAMVREKPAALAKHSPEVVVSIIEIGQKRIGMKQWRPVHCLDRWKDGVRRSKGLKAWIGGNGLRARGIPSVKPLALVERKDWRGWHESCLLMETFNRGQELDRYLCSGFKALGEKRQCILEFARWLSLLHQRGIFHEDMKTCNVLVVKNEASWDFFLLDLEDVRFDQPVTEEKFFKNLLQLNTSTPRSMTRTDRLRFFKECVRLNPIVETPKAFLRRLTVESGKRGLVYVSPQGVVIEPF